jgi:hypothetical protein
MDQLTRRNVYYWNRCFNWALAVIIFRVRISWTLFRLTYFTAGWPLYPAIVCTAFVFRIYTQYLVYIYTTSRNKELNRHAVLRGILLDEGLNRGRVFVAILMIACWHIHVHDNCDENLLKFADNACVKARGKRASELIL